MTENADASLNVEEALRLELHNTKIELEKLRETEAVLRSQLQVRGYRLTALESLYDLQSKQLLESNIARLRDRDSIQASADSQLTNIQQKANIEKAALHQQLTLAKTELAETQKTFGAVKKAQLQSQLEASDANVTASYLYGLLARVPRIGDVLKVHDLSAVSVVAKSLPPREPSDKPLTAKQLEADFAVLSN